MLEHNALTGRSIGAAVTVHRELGPGFLELREIAGPVFRVMRSYLRASRMHIGLILNFGGPALEAKRVFPEKKLHKKVDTSNAHDVILSCVS